MKYKNEYLSEISFPLGGIGSGSIGLCGNGALRDWEIFNHANKGSINGYSHFAVKAEYKGKKFVKVLNGDHISSLSGIYEQRQFGGFGYGPDQRTMCGFPHFSKCEFKGEFPIAEIKFSDNEFPVDVKLKAFSPFIPLDEDNSSLPAAFFEISAQNTLDADIDFTVAFSLMNPFKSGYNTASEKRLTFYSAENKESVEYGDLTVATDSENCEIQEYWHRTSWHSDNVVKYWDELSNAKKICNRHYGESAEKDHGTVYARVKAKAGQKVNVRFVLTWNIPRRKNDWSNDGVDTAWKNYYAVMFENSVESAKYALENWNMLYSRTDMFRKTLFSSTLDVAVKEAASSCLSVLRSAAVLRLEDGSFYGWEGLHEKSGSCEGTCQHVYNYAYALCFLFPRLERSVRDLEFKYSTDKNGYMSFRLQLPLGKNFGIWHACVDGQMGTVFKWYREWKLSGDTAWLKENWEKIKLILDFAQSEQNNDKWDEDGDGILEGRQHHTLDMELFGASSWLQGMYVLALKCAVEMAEYLGDEAAKIKYGKFCENGYNYIKNELFNGKYFIQKINLNDKSVLEKFGEWVVKNYWDEESEQIKYQIGEGSSVDQLLAKWHGNILGIDGIFDNAQAKIALQNVYKNNFKENLRNVVNTWRVFALNDEAGTVICDYPEGANKPTVPITYTEECMTGFEYAFAGLLISEGFIKEGKKVVKAIRDRYDGKKRNPYNELECGSNYARAMASFALIPIFSGYYFDLPNKCIGFDPVEKKDTFISFFSCGTCWGQFEKHGANVRIKICEGEIELEEIRIPFKNKVKCVYADGKKIPFEFKNGCLKISAAAKKSIRIE